MEKYSLLTKLAKCTLNIALKLTFSVFLFFFVFWLHFRPPRHCLRPFFERQFFTQMTVETREEKVGKPLLTGSALGDDKFRNICDMETIPPETDVLINNAHFPSFISPKFPFPRSRIANEVGNTRLRWGEISTFFLKSVWQWFFMYDLEKNFAIRITAAVNSC